MDWSGPYAGVQGGYAWGTASASGRAAYGAHAGTSGDVGGGVYAGFEAEYLHPAAAKSAALRVDSLFSFTPQVGYDLGGVLLRAKGGAAGGRVVSRLDSSIAGIPPTDQDKTRFGWTAGLGADYALAENWIVGLAFDYFDFGKFTFDGQANPDADGPLAYEVHPILRTATLRFSYKFGGGAAGDSERVEAAFPRPREPERAAASRDEAFQTPPGLILPESPILGPDADPAAALIESLKTGDERARAEAAVRLGELRSAAAALEPLIAALRDDSPAVRGASADALGKLGDRRGEPRMAALLHDPRPKVRALAARALGVLGDPRALAALRAASRDADPLVRRMADAALKRLAQPRAQTIDDLIR